MLLDRVHTLNLALARVFAPSLTSSSSSITGLAIDTTGEHALATVDDDTIRVVSVDKGAETKSITLKQRGVRLARWTHAANTVLVVSRHRPDISHLSLYDDTFLAHYTGHTGTVRSLDVNPLSDTFLTGASDDTVRVWDFRQSQSVACVALAPVASMPVASYDPQGLIFAIASHGTSVRLFDLRSSQSGPFTTFTIDTALLAASAGTSGSGQSLEFTTIQFSPEGQSILIGANSGKFCVLDAFDGHVKQILHSHAQSSLLDACFSADGNFVIAGCDDGAIRLFDANGSEESPAPMLALHGHLKHVRAVAMSHSRACLLTAAHEFGLWLPNTE